jgi:hypothetical protein
VLVELPPPAEPLPVELLLPEPDPAEPLVVGSVAVDVALGVVVAGVVAAGVVVVGVGEEVTPVDPVVPAGARLV